MFKKRRFLFLLVILAAILFLSSLSVLSEEIVLVDVIGREVVLEEPAIKVVGTHNPTLNAAVVLGGGRKYIAGFGNKEMSRGLYEAVIDDYDGLVQIGKGGNINFETVLATGADLAIIPERFKDQVEQFEKVGMKVIVALPNEESFDTIRQSLTLLGKALGATDRANLILSYLDDRIENAQKISSTVTEKKKVLFLGGSSALSVAPAAMIQTQLIDIAGGENAVSGIEGTGDFVEVNIEQIINWNPDVIWYPAYASYSAEDLLNNPSWSSIKAIQNKEIYAFPSKIEPWDQPTAALALGIAWATHNLHPDLYTIDEVMKDVDEFYNLVYGITFSAERLGIK
ncbi:MAG TPA: ABC transporter substrate-binding protein [Atribacterota bacterium]|nr:ABC transporter substrate-binding protein [Atribacterota bacterium]